MYQWYDAMVGFPDTEKTGFRSSESAVFWKKTGSASYTPPQKN
jgi:hypothetical protein